MEKSNGKKVAILTENGFEELELTSPKEALEQSGVEVSIVSPQESMVQGWPMGIGVFRSRWIIKLPKPIPRILMACLSPGELSIRIK